MHSYNFKYISTCTSNSSRYFLLMMPLFILFTCSLEITGHAYSNSHLTNSYARANNGQHGSTDKTNSPAAPVKLEQLVANRPITHLLKPPTEDILELNLVPDQYVHFQVEQLSVDVAITVFDSDGDEVFSVDAVSGHRGKEEGFFYSVTNGNYQIHVVASDDEKEKGEYRIKLDTIQPLTEHNKQIVTSFQHYLTGLAIAARNQFETLPQAIDAFESASVGWQGLSEWQARTFNRIGEIHLLLNNYQQAEPALLKALTIWQKLAQQTEEAETLLSLAEATTANNNYQKAHEYFDKALTIHKRLGDNKAQANDYYQLGNIALLSTKLSEATNYYKRALPLQEASKDRSGRAATLISMGRVAMLLSDYDSALNYCDDAFAIARAVGDRNAEIESITTIAHIYRLSGNRAAASENYQRAFFLHKKDLGAQGDVLNYSALTLFQNGEQDKVLELLNQALLLYNQTNDQRGQALVLRNIGAYYTQFDDPERGLDYYKQASKLFNQLDNGATNLSLNNEMASALIKLPDIARARTILDSNLKDNPAPSIERLKTLIIYANLATKIKQFDLAQEKYQAAIDLINRGVLDIKPLTFSFSQPPQVRDIYAAYIDLLMDQYQAKQNEDLLIKALELSEELKLNQLMDNFSSTIISDNNRANNRTNNKDDEPFIKRLNIKDVMAQLSNNEEIWSYFCGPQNSYLWTITHNNLVVKVLPNRDALEKSVQQLYRLVIDATLTPSSGDSEDEKLYRSDWAKQFNKQATELSKTLLPKLPQTYKKIFIVGDGAVQYLPFTALNTIAATHETPEVVNLNQGFEITNLVAYSQIHVKPAIVNKKMINGIAMVTDPVIYKDDDRLLELLNRNNGVVTENAAPDEDEEEVHYDVSLNGSATRAARATGWFELGTKLSRLTGGNKEAESLSTVFNSPTKMRLITGFEASKEGLNTAPIRLHRYLHLSVYGFLNSNNSRLSGLLLSAVDKNGKTKDGFLRTSEISDLKFNNEVVVISQSQTRITKNSQPEGITALAAAFKHAGAQHVLINLWKSNREAQNELMVNFYQAITKDKLSPEAALRAAQIKMQQSAKFSAPYFWAGYQIY